MGPRKMAYITSQHRAERTKTFHKVLGREARLYPIFHIAIFGCFGPPIYDIGEMIPNIRQVIYGSGGTFFLDCRFCPL